MNEYGHDQLSGAESRADAVWRDPESSPREDLLANAIKDLAAEVRHLRSRVAVLDGGDGIT